MTPAKSVWSAYCRQAKGWSWPEWQGPLPLGKLLSDFYTLLGAKPQPQPQPSGATFPGLPCAFP